MLINGRQVAEKHQDVPAPMTQRAWFYGGYFGADLNQNNGGVFFCAVPGFGQITMNAQVIASLSKIVAKFRESVPSGASFDGNSNHRIEPGSTNDPILRVW